MVRRSWFCGDGEGGIDLPSISGVVVRGFQAIWLKVERFQEFSGDFGGLLKRGERTRAEEANAEITYGVSR